MFTWKTHCGLKFHFGQFDRSEICTEVSFTPPEVMQTLIMKLHHTEVKFYPEVKSQTGLSSFRVSCKRALSCYKLLFSCQITISMLWNQNCFWVIKLPSATQMTVYYLNNKLFSHELKILMDYRKTKNSQKKINALIGWNWFTDIGWLISVDSLILAFFPRWFDLFNHNP